MAARATSILMEEAGLCNVPNQALQACPEVLGALYAAHYRHVLRVCRRFFWQPEDAEDAAAEVFLKLHSVLGSHDRPRAFRPWLSQVAGRHCIDKLRQRQREQRRCVEGEEDKIAALPDVSTPSPLLQVLRDEERRQVREELSRLPRRYRVALVLRYYKRMSYSEIARTLERQLPAIKTIIFRAKKELRCKLMGLERPQAAPGPPAGVFSPVEWRKLV